MFFLKFLTKFFFFFDKYGRVAAAHYGEARAHARPARRGARSTPRGYAPLESSGNCCLRQPMQTFFYCDSKGKIVGQKFQKKHFRSIFSPFQAISSNFGFFPFFDKCFFSLDPHESHFLTFGNDHTVVMQF